MLHKAEINNQIQVIRACQNGLRMNHLMFTDDLVPFFKATKQSCQVVNSILNQFQLAFGLIVNKSKSEVCFSSNTPKSKRKELAQLLKLKLMQTFGKYLDTYIDGLNRRQEIGKEILAKINKKLQGWKATLFSQARRLTLCRTILQNLPKYHFLTIKVLILQI